MDNLEQYQEIIKMIIGDYHRLNLKSPEPSIESFCVFDEVRDHYLLIVMGWEGSERLKSVMIHVRLHNGKFWIEEDWTEDGVATDLLRAGVGTEEIVLAFHPPQVRQYTEFAIA